MSRLPTYTPEEQRQVADQLYPATVTIHVKLSGKRLTSRSALAVHQVALTDPTGDE